MNTGDLEKTGESLYEAYRKALTGRSYSGASMPSWEGLKAAPENLYGAKAATAVQNQLRVRNAWLEVAKAADKVASPVVDLSPEEPAKKSASGKKAAKKKGGWTTKKKAAKRSK